MTPWQRAMIKDGTGRVCPDCGLVVQRTSDGDLNDSMSEHQLVVHLKA